MYGMYGIGFKAKENGKNPALIIDDDNIVFDGTISDIYLMIAKVLVIMEKDEEIPITHSLGKVDAYATLLKRFSK